MIGTNLIAVYRPLTWQIAPWRDRGGVLLLTGSAGGGKSRLAAEKIHAYLKKYPGATGVMLRKNRAAMTNSTVLFMERTVIGNDPEVTHFSSKHRFEYRNGSILAYGGMADDDQREQIRSIGVTGGVDVAWMEEANAFSEDDFNELRGRIRGRAAPWRQLILTTNPDSPMHWIKRRLMDRGEAAVYYSKAADNPNNPSEYLATLASMTGVLEQRLNRGLWVQAEGAVYENFDSSVHVIDPFVIPADWRRIRVVDFGYTNPFVCQWWAFDNDGRMYLYRELYMTQRTVSVHAKQIKELSKMINPKGEEVDEPIETTICDHDAEDRATLSAEGIPNMPAVKDVSPGIQRVQQRLNTAADGKPRLMIFKNALVETDRSLEARRKPVCTVQEFPGYVWPKDDGGRAIKETPVKLDDHGCLVGETEIATPNGPRLLKTIKEGDFVLGRNGPAKVLAAGMTQSNAPIMRVVAANGATIDGTYDHPVFVERRGYIYIDSLRYGDMLWYNDSQEENTLCYLHRIAKVKPKSLSTKGLNFGAILNQRTTATSIISRLALLTNARVLITFIVKSIATTLEQFHQGTKSITKMVIPLTTVLTTWNVCHESAMLNCTKSSTANQIDGGGEYGSSKKSRSARSVGTSQMKGESGTKSTVKRPGRVEGLLRIFASSAALTTKAKNRQTAAIAPTSAERQQGEQVVLITKRELANVADRSFKSTATVSSSIVRVPVEAVFATNESAPVYNLTVEGGEYFANGVLVHNCDTLRYAVMYADGPLTRVEYAPSIWG